MKVKIISNGKLDTHLFIDDLEISGITTDVTCKFPAGEKPLILIELLPDEVTIDGEILTKFRRKALED